MCGDEAGTQIIELRDSRELGLVRTKPAVGAAAGVHVEEIRGPLLVSARRRGLIHITHAKSGRQIRQIAKVLERLRIGQSVHVLHRQPVNHIAHSEFGDLAR